MKRSIESKLLNRFLSVVGVALAAMLVLFGCAMLYIRADVSKNELATGELAADSSAELLVEQALESNAAYVAEKADAIDRRLEDYIGKLRVMADATAYVYEHKELFPPSNVVQKPDEQIAAGLGEGNVMEWIPCDVQSDNAENRDICQRLGSLYGVLDALLERNPEIALLYIVTENGFTIGMDDALMMRAGIEYYEAREMDYFTKPMASGEVFLSPVYPDSFGKGDMITVSLPITVAGERVGVFAADILVEDLKTSVLDSVVGSIGGATLLDGSAAVICESSGFPEEAAQAARDALLSSERVTTFGTDGGESYLLCAPVATTGWNLAVSVARAQVVAPAERASAEINALTAKMLGELDQIIRWVALAIVALIALSMLALTLVIRRVCRTISKPITRLSEQVGAIGDGNLDFTNDIHTGDEIEQLGARFESMTVSLKEYIRNLTAVTAEKERIGAELSVATQIQANMLPSIFPPFPTHDEFDLYATMNPAKEVGGDFYDFFLVDDDHLALVIADVSGKGVPAALFMVIAKTLIKNSAQTGISPKELLEKVNNQLCENNEAEMFVTVWLGILEISSGRMVCANAGHEYPVLMRAGAAFELVKDKHGIVLAGMPGARYREYELQLNPGDRLFVYTDGVPEATDARNELYGAERMIGSLNRHKAAPLPELLRLVRKDVDAFVGDAPQFDDLTMLSLEISGKNG